MQICKAPTLQHKALNKRAGQTWYIAHIKLIEIGNIIHKELNSKHIIYTAKTVQI